MIFIFGGPSVDHTHKMMLRADRMRQLTETVLSFRSLPAKKLTGQQRLSKRLSALGFETC
mgnify:CR=1 FL=1